MIIEVSSQFEKELKQLFKKYKKIKQDLQILKKSFFATQLFSSYWKK